MGISRSCFYRALASRTFSLPLVTRNGVQAPAMCSEGVLAIARPDLMVYAQGAPHRLCRTGHQSTIKVVRSQHRRSSRSGNNGVINPAGGYMIDVVFSRDGNVPAGLAVFYPTSRRCAAARGAEKQYC